MHRTETKRRLFLCNLNVGLAAVIIPLTFVVANYNLSFVAAKQGNADLTGNWVAQTQNSDGTFRRSYFNLKQEGTRITGATAWS